MLKSGFSGFDRWVGSRRQLGVDLGRHLMLMEVVSDPN